MPALTIRAAAVRAAAEDDFVPAFPALTLAYRDHDGQGSLALQPRGHDPATGGALIAVRLTQNGGAFTGEGFVLRLDGRTSVLAFNLPDNTGAFYLFSGLLRRESARWSAAGQYRPVGRAGSGREWRAGTGVAVGPLTTTSVPLAPVAGSTVYGTVGLTALLEGETRYDLTLTGLATDQEHTVLLHGGTPEQPGASVTPVTTVVADITGNATASGLLRFRGTEPIALRDIADGQHFLSVVRSGATLALGVIPSL